MLADPATEDHGDLVGLPDCSIGIEQAFTEVVQCRAAMEDEVVAELDLREEQPMLAANGNGFIKQYVRDHLILRTEAASNNVNDYGVKKSVQNLSALRRALSAINDNYLNVQQDILETFIDRGQLRRLAEPTITPAGKRIPGLRLDHPRQLALMHALVRFALRGGVYQAR